MHALEAAAEELDGGGLVGVGVEDLTVEQRVFGEQRAEFRPDVGGVFAEGDGLADGDGAVGHGRFDADGAGDAAHRSGVDVDVDQVADLGERESAAEGDGQAADGRLGVLRCEQAATEQAGGVRMGDEGALAVGAARSAALYCRLTWARMPPVGPPWT